MDLLLSVVIYLTGFSVLIVSRHVQCCVRGRAELLARYKRDTMQRQRQAFLRATG